MSRGIGGERDRAEVITFFVVTRLAFDDILHDEGYVVFVNPP